MASRPVGRSLRTITRARRCLLHRLGHPEIVLDRGNPQAVVSAGVWQAAEPSGGAVLCGCTVAPGFEFEDFELATAALIGEFPAEAEAIRRLLR